MVTHKDALGRAAYVLRQRGITSGQMEAAIRAYLDARGLVMVPKEPTIKMRRAGNMQVLCGMDEIIIAAIAAAPDPFQEASE